MKTICFALSKYRRKSLTYLCTLLVLPNCISCTNNVVASSLAYVGPPAMASCMKDERMMTQYHSANGIFKELVGGVRENSQTVACYWGSSSITVPSNGDAQAACRNRGDICAVLMGSDELLSTEKVLFIPSDSESGKKVLSAAMEAKTLFGTPENKSKVLRTIAWQRADEMLASPAPIRETVSGTPLAISLPSDPRPNISQTNPSSTSEYSVVWYLLGQFAAGVALGFAQPQPAQRSNVITNENRRAPMTCVQTAGFSPTFTCQ
jgi:hypothetical protein